MKGFFIVELIIVMSLVAIFASLSLTGFLNLEQYFLKRSTKNEIITILDRTRNFAIGMRENDGWSFRIENGRALIYKGNDFNNREVNFDEFYDLPKKALVNTTSDIYFSPMTGYSNNATTTIEFNSTTESIFVSNNGFIK